MLWTPTRVSIIYPIGSCVSSGRHALEGSDQNEARQRTSSHEAHILANGIWATCDPGWYQHAWVNIEEHIILFLLFPSFRHSTFSSQFIRLSLYCLWNEWYKTCIGSLPQCFTFHEIDTTNDMLWLLIGFPPLLLLWTKIHILLWNDNVRKPSLILYIPIPDILVTDTIQHLTVHYIINLLDVAKCSPLNVYAYGTYLESGNRLAGSWWK